MIIKFYISILLFIIVLNYITYQIGKKKRYKEGIKTRGCNSSMIEINQVLTNTYYLLNNIIKENPEKVDISVCKTWRNRIDKILTEWEAINGYD